jgi:predicted dehydrogenase
VLLADPEIEGVIVTTPNDTHQELITQALEAGKGVFVDKPIANTMTAAWEISQAAERTGGTLAIGHSARRLAGHRIARAWIEDGRLGEPALAVATFTNERSLELDDTTWRSQSEQSPGGGLVQLGVHHFDTLEYLLGPIAAIGATVRRVHSVAEVPDLASIMVEFDSGVVGSVATGWSSPGSYEVDVFGTRENLYYELEFTHWHDSHLTEQHCKLESQAYRSGERVNIELPASDMFREELEEFALALRGEARVEVGPREATRALAGVFAALESSRRGGSLVPIAEILDGAGAGALV